MDGEIYRAMHVPLKGGDVWMVAAMGEAGWSTKAGPGIKFEDQCNAEHWITVALPIREAIRATPRRKRQLVKDLLAQVSARNVGFLRMLDREGLEGDWRSALVRRRIAQLDKPLGRATRRSHNEAAVE